MVDFEEMKFPDWIIAKVTKTKSEEKVTLSIDEPKFCEIFRKDHDIVRINGNFWLNGNKVSDDEIKKLIQDEVSIYFKEKTGRRTDDLFKTLANSCFTQQPDLDEWKIYCQGDVTLNVNLEGKFTAKKEKIFTLTRLPVAFDNTLKKRCPTFEKYLNDLFYEEDIPAIQEFFGYCLVPSTRAQAGLFIKGDGGEGKSVLRDVAMHLFGHAAVQVAIHELNNPFTLIQMENKLICIDDDLKTEYLNETGTLKKLITASGKFLLNEKHQPMREGLLFSRVLALGNSFIGAKFDHSDGFYRRQLLINCKPKTRADEDDDKFMSDKVIAEIEGIFTWALIGLKRLINNNYNFTVSKHMQETLDGVKREGNNVLTFTEDQTALEFTNQFYDYVTSDDLFKAYAIWCFDNGDTPVKRDSFKRRFPDVYKKRITSNECGKCKVPGGNGQVNGYTGVKFTIDMDNRLKGLLTVEPKLADRINRLP